MPDVPVAWAVQFTVRRMSPARLTLNERIRMDNERRR
jgi:hypothetical protein